MHVPAELNQFNNPPQEPQSVFKPAEHVRHEESHYFMTIIINNN